MERRAFIKKIIFAGFAAALSGTELLASTTNTISYKVQQGDTLSTIAERHGTNTRTLQRLNRLKNDRIKVGQHLVIPFKVTYRYLSEVMNVSRRLKIVPNRWTHVVTHHSGIERGNAESYGAYHRRRGMKNGLAYHFVIGNGVDSPEGHIEIGPRWLSQENGGHVRTEAFNEVGIGICLVGNFENRSPSAKQLSSLYELCDYLKGNLRTKNITFAVHKEIDGPRHTVCPGRHFPLQTYHQKFG